MEGGEKFKLDGPVYVCEVPFCNWFDKPTVDVMEHEAESMNCFFINCDDCINFCFRKIDEEGDVID